MNRSNFIIKILLTYLSNISIFRNQKFKHKVQTLLSQMVGYDPKNPSNFNQTELFFVGSATSIASRFIVHPLDVVKIRFQVISSLNLV